MYIQINDGGCAAHAKLLQNRIAERVDAEFVPGGMRITLAQDAALGGSESYQITGAGTDWHVTGADERGLYYGIGKFLRSASWSEKGFVPQATGGVISPACPFRCIYYALHFHNWYYEAPIEELTHYVEDLLLYGYNTVCSILPVVHFKSLEDQTFYDAVQKTRIVYSLAKKYGMKTSLIIVPNQGLITAPHLWDADLSYEDPDAPRKYRGSLGRNICPNKPGAMEYLRGIWIKSLEQFLDIGIDYLFASPYDEGGCGCSKCAPWGANGFDKVNRVMATDLKRMYPNAKFIYSTWTFDLPNDQGEYSTVYRRLAQGEMDYVDYLMTDAHDNYPRYPLEHPVVRPIFNFPEISMWGLFPWGGFGANPLPKRFERLWDSSKSVLSGGMPYSEGLYEDLSKVQCVGYYWNKNARYADTLREYAEYEFGAGVGDDAVRLMELIETNHAAVQDLVARCVMNPKYTASPQEKNVPNLAAAQEALALAQDIDRRLPERGRRSWRWRILLIRATLDAKRYAAFLDNGMTITKRELLILRSDMKDTQLLKDDAEAQALFQELRGIYHCLDHDNGKNKWTLPVVQGAM